MGHTDFLVKVGLLWVQDYGFFPKGWFMVESTFLLESGG